MSRKNNKLANELEQRMMEGVVTFTVKRFAMNDIAEQFPIRCSVQGTLVNYEKEFGRAYVHREGNQYLVFWDVASGEWHAVRCINLLK
ncbi:hypothetical protein [Phocaeicola sp.]